jgi:4-amino-4-deoxy-L-arabinose transferase-like glycosyltransferase
VRVTIQVLREGAGRLDDRGWLLLIGGLALVIRLPLIVASGDVAWAGDTAEYMQLADGLADGDFHTDYRMPGYPLFIALLDLLPGSREMAVISAQHLLGIGVVLALVHFGSRWLGRVAGVASALLAVLTPILLGLEHTLQPDFLFGSCVFAGCVLLVLAALPDRLNVRLLVLAGVALAAASYVKPVGVAVVGGVFLGLFAGSRAPRQAAIGGAVVAATMAVLLIPWAIRNEVAYGHFTLSTQGGQTLFKRLFDVDGHEVPTSTADGRLVARLQEEQHRTAPGRELNSYVSEELQRRGYSADAAVALERRVALTAVREDPIAYLAATPGRLSRFLTDLNSFTYDDVTGGENSSGFNPDERSAPVRLAIQLWFGLSRALSEVWWILSLHVLAGLLLLLSADRIVRMAAGVFASMWLGVALATALGHGGLRRYSAQMAPEAWLLGAAGAVLVCSALWRAVRQLRAEP